MPTPTAGGSLLNQQQPQAQAGTAGGSMLGAPQQQQNWQQPVQGAGGFDTTGLQYGVQGSGQGIQGGIAPGQTDTSKIAGYQPGVTNIDPSERYRQDAADAYYQQGARRLDPRFAQEQASGENQLANMGLTRGSEAWNNEMQRMTFNKNDAYGNLSNQATLMGGQEAQRMQGMDINRGNFMNNAGQQGFQNNLTSQEAQNRAFGQEFSQGERAGNFANQANQQAWNQNYGQANLNNQALLGQRGIDAQRESSANSLAASQIGGQNARYMADLQNSQFGRRMDYDENQFNYGVAQDSLFNPLRYQDMALRGQGPGGAPPGADPGVPSYGQRGSQQSASQNNPIQGYGQMGGGLWNAWNSPARGVQGQPNPGYEDRY